MDNILEKIYKQYTESSGVSIDTRKLKKGNIFFAIKGDRFDGNDFIKHALDKGASFIVTSNKELITNKKCIYVKNTLVCLQNLATFHRVKLNIPVIGITGSNGKTTTKNLTTLVLKSTYKVYSTKGNFNNHIGVPLSILDLNASHEIAVIEMGASGLGEIAFLCEISRPNVGLITNISPVHLEGFGNFESVIRGKSELFDYLIKNEGIAFINNNDKVLLNFSKRFEKPYLLFGDTAFVKSEFLKADPYISFSLDENEIIQTKMIGDYNFENILSAISIGKYFGVDTSSASKAVCEYEPSQNRSQVIEKNNFKIILDAYNANPTSVFKALSNFSNIEGKKIVILGDMLELGRRSKIEHRKLGTILQGLNFDIVYLVGKEMKYAFENYSSAIYFENRKDIYEEMRELKFKNSTVLLKASRGMEFEKIVNKIK